MVKDFIEYLRNEKRSVRSILTYSLLGSVLLLSIPFLIQTLVQQYTLLVFQQSTTFLLLLITSFLIGIAGMRILQMHLTERLLRRIFVDTINRAQKKSKELKKNGETLPVNDWNYIFEAVNLQKSLVPLLVDGSIFSVQAIIVLIVITFYHPLFIVYSALIASALYFITVKLGKKTAELSLAESNKKYEIIKFLQMQTTSPSAEIPQQVIEDKILDYFTVREERYQQFFKQTVGLLIVKIVASLTLIFIGGLLVLQNKMTIGQLVASELIITNMLVSLFKFTNLLDYLYDAHVGIQKINKYYPAITTHQDLK